MERERKPIGATWRRPVTARERGRCWLGAIWAEKRREVRGKEREAGVGWSDRRRWFGESEAGVGMGATAICERVSQRGREREGGRESELGSGWARTFQILASFVGFFFFFFFGRGGGAGVGNYGSLEFGFGFGLEYIIHNILYYI